MNTWCIQTSSFNLVNVYSYLLCSGVLGRYIISLVGISNNWYKTKSLICKELDVRIVVYQQSRPKWRNQDNISQPGNHRPESETAINLAVFSTGKRSGASISRARRDGQGQGEAGGNNDASVACQCGAPPSAAPPSYNYECVPGFQFKYLQDRMINLRKKISLI